MSVQVQTDAVEGVTRFALPVGVHGVETVNVYALPDGDRVTLVDIGCWRKDAATDGVAVLESGLRGIGYELRDVTRIIVTHAHIDHYGLAGRVMELTGAQLWMHALTDLDTEKYRHPDTAMARRRDMYIDHGLPADELDAVAGGLENWLPYLHSVVEASRRLRGGETIRIGGRPWEVVHTPGHSVGHVCLYSPDLGLVFSGDHLLPGVTPPVTFERGFDADPLRSYLDSLRVIADKRPRLVLPGHGRPFADVTRRIEVITRTKERLLRTVRDAIAQGPKTVVEVADQVFGRTLMSYQRHFTLSETLAHIAYLRSSGVVERRIRPDDVYEWYATGRSSTDERLGGPGGAGGGHTR